MKKLVKTIGHAKAWTTSTWRGIDEIDRLIAEGYKDEAISAMSYSNNDMSGSADWTEVGIAEITVTFYARDTLVAKELEGLNTQLQRVRAENHWRENAILDRISKLQALEYKA